MKYIYHHLGLGDHIICNGLVRHYQKKYDNVTVFCKPQNFNNIVYMYRDNKNINVLNIGEDNDVKNYIQKEKINNDVIKVGFEHLIGGETFDECFYIGKSLSFNLRFEEFYIKRDLELEKKILLTLNPKNEKYIFTHNVNPNKLRKDLKIIENPTDYCIFNLLSLIENAEEIHLMESSLKCLVNSYKIENPKFFYHQYVRGYTEFHNTKGLNKFEIIY